MNDNNLIKLLLMSEYNGHVGDLLDFWRVLICVWIRDLLIVDEINLIK